MHSYRIKLCTLQGFKNITSLRHSFHCEHFTVQEERNTLLFPGKYKDRSRTPKRATINTEHTEHLCQ